MTQFFIQRPVFAWVLSIVTVLCGILGAFTLPIAQYPEVSPPTVRVSATYSGASAEAVQNSVTEVLEDELTGLDGMIYMESSSTRGSSSITVVFDQDIDPNDAQVDVQNKISGVTSQLPQSVQDKGVNVRRSTSSILMIGALVSEDDTYTTVKLADMLENTVSGPIQRTSGVGDIHTFGSGFAMRIWLDPYKLVKYALTPSDITSAIKVQNTTVAVGALGDVPYIKGQQFTIDVTAQSQLKTVDDFRNILLKTTEEGAAVLLSDVARGEIGQETYGRDSRFNRKNAAGFGVNLATGANAVDTADAVKKTIEDLKASLPEGVSIEYAYDTSPFVQSSIEKVVETIVEAIILVFLVLLVFLHSWRATVIPSIAVPVVLMGTFGILALAGYSINTLTMFAMVLAIGMLVDDAIVVVENVQRLIQDEGLDPMAATKKSMKQITGALVGTTLVIITVFLPMAFFSGSTGIIYRQFSVTIVSAMAFSLLIALILSPTMCASMLHSAAHDGDKKLFTRLFNRYFGYLQNAYVAANKIILQRAFLSLFILIAVCAGVYILFKQIPGSFLPQEDQGVLMCNLTLPQRSTSAQTLNLLKEIEDYLLTDEAEAVDATFVSLGFSFGGTAQNKAMIFIRLKDFAERAENPELSASAVAHRANMHFMQKNRLGSVYFLQPPAIQGMGNTGGFSMYLIDQAANGQKKLMEAADKLVAAAEDDGRVTNLQGNEQLVKTAMRIDIDQQKAASFGLTLSEVNSMLAVIFSGSEVNDFQMDNELRPVLVQGDAEFRMQPDDLHEWYARNSSNEMVPFASFMKITWEELPSSLDRFGATRALSLTGSAVQGVSSGAAMDIMEEQVKKINGYGVAWTGLSYQERLSGSQAPMLYAVSVLVVFLALAALYESWSMPVAIMLVVPIGILGALAGALAFSQANDVYFKVGMLATIGLAAKNAILIVEFAVELQREGMEMTDAVIEASRQRLRPIIMTSLTFILGVMPLAFASGAGAGAQNAIGVAVLFGMIAATAFGIFFIPAFMVCVQKIFRIKYSSDNKKNDR